MIEAFKDLETQDKMKVAFKRCHETMKHVGASTHALLYSALPVFSLKEELVKFSKKVREEGVLPWSSLDEGPDSFYNWVENLSFDINDTVLKASRILYPLGQLPSMTR